MGVIIKKHRGRKEPSYKLISSVSDEALHPEAEWISENEAKKILIDKAFWRFLEAAIEIDMTFPNGYEVNGERCFDYSKPSYHEWMLRNAFGEDGVERVMKKFGEIYRRLNLDYNFENGDR